MERIKPSGGMLRLDVVWRDTAERDAVLLGCDNNSDRVVPSVSIDNSVIESKRGYSTL